MTLTDKQLRKIFAAQEQGISKREIFEADVAGTRVRNLTKRDQERLVSDILAKKPIPEKFQAVRPKSSMTPRKAMALMILQQDKKAKEAFLKQDSLRLQSFRAEQLR